MACFSAKVAYWAAVAGVAVALAALVPGAATGPGEAALIAALIVAMAGYIAAALALAECMEAAGRREDGEALRRDIDEMQREMDRLRELVGQ